MAKKTPASTAPPTDGRISRRPVELGASGTENYGGYLSGLDYNSQLAPPNGFRIYDEMRRSDPQVRASLEIIKLPLLSAAWSVQPPENPTPQEQELTDFCRTALLDQGAMTETWDYVLRHALLALDFGCSTLEKVYVLKATPFGEKIGLDRLAPRLPWTIEKFHVDERQKLAFIEQRALKADGKGGGTTQNLMIPADRVAHLVHRREGDNYFGESILRSAYKPWVFKFAAEKADAVRVYRQVAGVPMASYDMEVAQKASAQTPDKDEIARVESMLRGMATSKLEFLRTSTLWRWSWMHGSSDGKSADVEKTIERHDRAILRNVLGDFMAGAADGLNSGKTRTLTDFFGAALYAIAHLIEDELSLHVLRPLAALNFPTQGLRFPRLQADDVTDIDVAQIAETLAKLGINYVQPDDTLEEALRKLVGLPPRDVLTTRKPPSPPPFGQNAQKCPDCQGSGLRPERGMGDPEGQKPCLACGGTGRRAPGNAPARDDESGDDPETAPTLDRAAKKGEKDAEETSAELRALRAQKGRVFGGRTYSREPRPFELFAFNVAEVPDMLDATTADLRTQLEAIRRKQLNVLAAKLTRGDAVTAGRPDDVVVPFKKDVEAAFKRALTSIYQYGRTQVQLELAKQGRDVRLVAASSLVLAGAAGKNSRTAKSALTTSAKVATEKETDYWVNRIIETAARLRRNGLEGPDLASRIQDALSADVEQGVLPLAKSEVNEGFAIGRQAEATAQQDEIDYVEYSALLDANTCEACAALDGKTFAFGSDEYHETLPPYQGCEGNKGQPDACRCVHLYHAKKG